MPYFKFEDILKTNIPEIDEQHKKLIDLTNELYDAIKKGVASEIEEKMLIEVTDYVKFHFNAEEQIIKKNTPGEYQQHKMQHTRLIDKMAETLKHYTPGNIDVPTEIFEILKFWVNQHIKKTDSRYVK